ncbi:MAG TPA: hypothetical protein VMM85_03390 [Methylomirabilota bacterium]|nr:hypothetical protein [Methylomirabilota bacterium]
MKRSTLTVLVVVVGLLLLADFLVVNEGLGELVSLVLEAVILVAAGAALAGAVALGMRRVRDLRRRRGDPVGALLLLGGLGAMLLAGLRPGSEGAADPVVGWMVVALLVPIGATLFALLFVTTLAAARRSLAAGGRETTVMLAAAAVAVLLLLPLSGPAGDWLAGVAGWSLAVPIGAVFRGLLIGVAILTALVAARTLLGIGAADE